jgi:hypothetical protein
MSEKRYEPKPDPMSKNRRRIKAKRRRTKVDWSEVQTSYLPRSARTRTVGTTWPSSPSSQWTKLRRLEVLNLGSGQGRQPHYCCHTLTQSTSVWSSSGVVESGSGFQPPIHMFKSKNMSWLNESQTGAEWRN